MHGQKLGNQLFYPVMFGCVAISTLATLRGLEPTFGKLAPIGAAILCCSLIGALTVFHWRREKKDRRTAGPLAFFALILLLSTACNVNYFYTRYFERDLARDAYRGALESFKFDIEDAKKTLREDTGLVDALQRGQKIDELLLNLRAQANDPLNRGIGPLAQGHIAEIKKLLPGLANLAVPTGTDAKEIAAWYTRFEDLVKAHLQKSYSAQQRDYLQLKADMDADYQAYVNLVQGVEAASEGDHIGVKTQQLLGGMHLRLAEYQGKVNGLLTKITKVWSPPRDIDPESGRIGDIARTFGTVLSGKGNVPIFLVCLFLSFIIDSIPLFFSLALVDKAEEEAFNPYALDGGIRH